MSSGNESNVPKEEELERNTYDVIMILWADHNLYLYSHRSCSAVDSTKEHNLVFAHGQDFDFWTGCREFKDARINFFIIIINDYTIYKNTQYSTYTTVDYVQN